MSRPAPPGPLRRGLDALYDASAAISALCLVGILTVIVAQMVARWLGITFPGATEYAGYLMAAASFLAFAHTLNRGGHIRVTLFLDKLVRGRLIGEFWCLAIGTAATSYLAFYAGRLVYWSWKLRDVSQGQDAMPLWIVQMPVAYGAGLLALAFWDNLAALLRTGRDNISAGDTADIASE